MARLTSLSPHKAKKMLSEGMVRGKKLTRRQRRFFGLIAGGGTPTRMRKRGFRT